MQDKIEFGELELIARKAGEQILEIYNQEDISQISEEKSDKSPLTLADKKSHNYIIEALHKLAPKIPVISEEGKEIPFETRRNWDYYWLVDPLDGTKEFLKRNGQFTVNIALMKKNTPISGVIYVPVSKITYLGGKDMGSFKISGDGEKVKIKVNKKVEKLIAVKSKSHSSEAENKTLKTYDVVDFIEVGSSLKFCMVAEGKADIYYRAGPTMEWDTAAGQAVVEGAGGIVLNEMGEIFTYNKASLLNGSFICKGF
ncbi:3'(2'),5'-bisphosphate nucleotidase CysQ [soil metagenome]